MSRRTALLLGAALTVGVLTGCSTAPSADCIVTPTGSAIDAIKVTYDASGVPTLDYPVPFSSPGLEVRVLEEGDGPVVSAGTFVRVKLAGYLGANDAALGALGMAGYDGDELLGMSVDPTVSAFAPAMACAREGERRLISMPVSSLPENIDTVGLEDTDNLIYLIEVERVYKQKADGAPVWVTDSGLPTVITAPDGTPGISVPKTDAPTELKIVNLKAGNGDVVTENSQVTLQYSLMVWVDKTIWETSWDDAQPVTFSPSNMISGFKQALVGQKVGSQVLAVVPPSEGYGNSEGHALQNSTLIFVIDILGID